MSDQKPKHLEFIQGVITRMNTNSFQIKGWTITIVAALLAVYASTKTDLLIIVSALPVVVFWFLDSYYLWQESKYRGLYNAVADTSTAVAPFSMNADEYEKGTLKYLGTLRSRTVLWLYLPLMVLLVSAYLYLNGCFGGEPAHLG